MTETAFPHHYQGEDMNTYTSGRADNRDRKRFVVTGLALAIASMQLQAASPAMQSDPDQKGVQAVRRSFDIAAQALDTAIIELSRQADVVVTAPSHLLAGRSAPAIQGIYPVQEALRLLLEGSGLGYRRTEQGGFVIEGADEGASSDRADMATLGTIAVTGTRIRGAATPSPVISIGEAQVREGGYKDLGEVIRSIPQNFSGGQNPGVTIGASAGGIANQNINSGSALNLRGIGPDATLTLLNGRRLPYSAMTNAVDISVIPLTALSRIEVIADGASAIYGSDAVAGVANVITKREFEGTTASFRIGTTTDGGGTDRRYGLTTGKAWGNGGFIAAYEYSDSQAVFADQRSYLQYMLRPHVIMPDMQQHSVFASLHQGVGDSVALSVDAVYARRDSSQMDMQGDSLWGRDAYVRNFSIYPNIEVLLPADWSLSIGAGYGQDESTSYMELTPYAAGYPGLPTGAASIPYHAVMINQSRSVDIGFEGPLAHLESGDIRLAVGAGYRDNDFEWRYYSAGNSTQGDRSSRYAYGEVFVPLVSPEQNRGAARRFDITLAARYEDYDEVGNVTTPKFGFVYQPNASFTLKGSWGESYKVPNLTQTFQPVTIYLYPATAFGLQGYPADATAMLVLGGGQGLQPEEATSKTGSLVFHPESLPGFQAEISYFDIAYEGRVVTPLTNYSSVDQDFVVPDPSAAAQQAALALTGGNMINASGAAYDPNQVIGLFYNRYVNLVRQHISGVDLSGSYELPFLDGELTLQGSATWLKVRQQNVESQPEREITGRIFYPAGFRARAGASWQRQGLTLSSFLNHMEGSTDDRLAIATVLASHTTVDLNARYGFGPEFGWFSGVELAFSVHNVMDRAPPLFQWLSNSIVNYDSTNHSALGRFVSLSVSKHW